MSEFKGMHQKKLRVRLRRPEGEISRRELLKKVLPFGRVELDNSQCTGCGLCALECPTEALSITSTEEASAYQLLFRQSWCVACGRCVKVCPEKCLQLERVLELDKIDSPPAVLFEDSIVRCRQCGSIISSGAMIHRLQAKLQGAGSPLTSQLELCPICRIEHLGGSRLDMGVNGYIT